MQTDPLPVNVRPLVAADEPQPEPQPERPPRSAWVEDQRVVRALKWGGIGLGGAIVLLIGGAAHPARAGSGARRPTVSRRGERAAPRARRGRDREADGAARSGQFAVDGYRPFYFALTEIVREYLGARYGFDALEMTTTELLDELSRAPSIWSAEGAEVPRFFATAISSKFAKAGSTDARGAGRARRGAGDRAVDGGAARGGGAVDLRARCGCRGESRRLRAMAESPPGARGLGALAPYLLTLAIALPFALYYFVALRGPDIHWRNKWALLLLAAVPLGAWVGFHLERRRVGTMAFSRTHDLRRHAAGRFGYLMHLPRALPARRHRAGRRRAGAAAAAVADPAEVEGIDIVVALDVSNSMRETDMRAGPHRRRQAGHRKVHHSATASIASAW